MVFTGGEPALQLTAELLERLHAAGVETGVESNGTLPLPPGLDWITVSPKAGTRIVTLQGQECKLVWPQPGAPELDPETLRTALCAQGARFTHWILQPCDLPPGAGASAAGGADKGGDTPLDACIRYCLAHPVWRLGLQTHKLIGVR